MKTLSIVLALSIFSFATAAWSADSSTPKSTDATKTTKSPAKLMSDSDDEENIKPPKTSAPAKAAVKPIIRSKKKQQAVWVTNTENVAARVGSFVAGTAIGIPIAAPRLFLSNDVEHAKSIPWLGESKNKSSIWASRVMVIPTAGFVAIISAPYYSAIRSWKASSEKPFSKECFSLGDFDETIAQP